MRETQSPHAPSLAQESGPRVTIRKVPILMVLGLLLMRTVLLLLGDGVSFGIAQAFNPDATVAGVLLYSNVVVVGVDIITLLTLVAVLHREGKTLRSLLDRFRFIDLVWGLLLFVITIVGFFIATYIGNLIVYRGPPPVESGSIPNVPLWLALWTIVIMPVTVAIAEETLYRGYLQSRLTARFGLWVGLLVPAVFFGLQHLAFSLTTPQAATARVIAMTLFGVMFGALYLWRKRLGQLIFAHWLFDVIGLGLPLLMIAN